MAQPTYTRLAGVREAHKPFAKPFLQLIEKVARREGWREGDAFSRFLEFSTLAMVQAPLKMLSDVLGDELAAAKAAKFEAQYMDGVRRCRRPTETMADFAAALPIVVEALKAERADFIGPIFTELSANTAGGQFFTPYDVSLLMAKISLPEPQATLDTQRGRGANAIFGSEPAVGVGGMVLAASQVIRDAGLEPARHAHWVCVDTDWRACCGAYVQLTLAAVSATIICGNSLTLEERESLPTLMAVMFPKRRGDLKPPVARENRTTAPLTKAQQLELFD